MKRISNVDKIDHKIIKLLDSLYVSILGHERWRHLYFHIFPTSAFYTTKYLLFIIIIFSRFLMFTLNYETVIPRIFNMIR